MSEEYYGFTNYETWCLSAHWFIDDWVHLYMNQIKKCHTVDEIDTYLEGMRDFIQQDFEDFIANETQGCSEKSIVHDLLSIDKIDWLEIHNEVCDSIQDVLQEKLDELQNTSFIPHAT